MSVFSLGDRDNTELTQKVATGATFGASQTPATNESRNAKKQKHAFRHASKDTSLKNQHSE